MAILMTTYNGEEYLHEQLNSFLCQSYGDWELWVSDDGSRDSTKTILKKFQKEQDGMHSVTVVDGPRRGFAENFLNLVELCDSSAEFYAFSDQDDVWYDDKLMRAVNYLKTIPAECPALYCSRTEIVDENLKSMGFSSRITLSPSFENALVQSIAGGNTMVFNRTAKELLKDFGGVLPVPSHDWWLYLVITSVEGIVIYDPVPSIFYRQHGENTVGSNQSFLALLSRLTKFLFGQYKKYNDENMRYLSKKVMLITKGNQKKLRDFISARNNLGVKGIKYLRRSGAKRNGLLFNLALWAGIFIGRV